MTRTQSITGVGLALGLLAAAACGGGSDSKCGAGDNLPDSWSLSASGITVDIQRAPYGFAVKNEAGETVLATAEDDEEYGAIGRTTGKVLQETYVSPGYYTFSAFLEPWKVQYEVVAVEEADDSLLVTLAGAGGCVEVEHSVRNSALRIEASSSDETRAWASAFQTDPDEGFLGFGERFNTTNQRGLDVFSWAEEGGIGAGEGTAAGPENPFPNGQSMAYYPVPFFLSTNGYGFWLDTTYRSEFNLASQRPDAWRAWHIGPSMAFEIYVPTPGDTRPWPYHVIDHFTAATGRPMLPPAWTYGPRRRINRDDKQGELSEIAAMRAEDLAITSVDDALHFYPSAGHIGDEIELAAWISSAAELGYKVNGYFNSFVDQRPDSKSAAWATEGDVEGHFLKTAEGEYPELWIITGGDLPPLYLVDFTNPRAKAWYQSSFKWATDLGYAGWMYDFGEYVPLDVVAADGTTGEALHNLYPTLYAQAVHEAMEASPQKGDWLAFMRSGYTGSSAFTPMVWSGDPAASFEESDGLPSMIPAALNLGISGAPNSGGDIGGFHCTADGGEAADAELITRWIQQGSMMPNMQDQDACVGGGVKANIFTSMDAQQAWREYARLHTRLFPYFYTLAHEANSTGAPIMRHLFLEHPERTDLASVGDAYYLGSSLLVAPVVRRDGRDKTIDLPAGSYLDWKDQTIIEGGQTVTIDAPLAKLPLLLRENHLLPLLDPTIDTLAKETHPDVVGADDVANVYDVVGYLTGGQATFQLWDGETFTADLSGAISAPGLTEAGSEQELSTCDGCYLLETLPSGVTRLRISTTSASVTAGGLALSSSSARRVRWDLYIK